jgi:hypothetical protein
MARGDGWHDCERTLDGFWRITNPKLREVLPLSYQVRGLSEEDANRFVGYPAVIVAAVVSLLAHFAVGAAKSLITIRSWWSSGLEMTYVGAIEGIGTYLIGIVLGRIGGAGI